MAFIARLRNRIKSRSSVVGIRDVRDRRWSNEAQELLRAWHRGFEDGNEPANYMYDGLEVAAHFYLWAESAWELFRDETSAFYSTLLSGAPGDSNVSGIDPLEPSGRDSDGATKLSAHGMPKWFSPQHAAEKFREVARELGRVAERMEKNKQMTVAEELWVIAEVAEKYERYYSRTCPIQSVRIMEPSGAIYVMLADGREVTIPQ